jgi:hypothetical protein
MLALTVKIPGELKDPPKPARERTSLYVEADTWAKLGTIAQEIGRSRNSLVRGLLKEWIEWYETAGRKPKR